MSEEKGQEGAQEGLSGGLGSFKFDLSGGRQKKKSKRIVDDSFEEEDRFEVRNKNRKSLVIPAINPEEPAKSAEGGEKTLEERALLELTREARGEDAGPVSKYNLVIHAPGASEDEKFRTDLTSRAEDLDPTSDAYDLVPIEEFGKALLRGVGWDGTLNDPKSFDIKPRPYRMGLGAKLPSESLKEEKQEEQKEEEEAWSERLD